MPKFHEDLVLKAKGLASCKDRIAKKFGVNVWDARACTGWLQKKGGGIGGVGTSFTKRWFILVSSRPLRDPRPKNQQKDYYGDGLILSSSFLPNWMEFDVIYYFGMDKEHDRSKFRGKIEIKDVIEAEIEDAKKYEKDQDMLSALPVPDLNLDKSLKKLGLGK